MLLQQRVQAQAKHVRGAFADGADDADDAVADDDDAADDDAIAHVDAYIRLWIHADAYGIVMMLMLAGLLHRFIRQPPLSEKT